MQTQSDCGSTVELMLNRNLACEGLYRFLAAALRDPAAPSGELLRDPNCRMVAAASADLLRSQARHPARLGFGELPATALDLGGLLPYLEASTENRRVEYYRVFGLLPARECQPYETEYHTTEEPFFRAQQLADVAGFYRAFGLEPAQNDPERPDHLPLELEFMAFLLLKQRLAENPAEAAVCGETRETFFRDHLSWWVPSFTVGLRRRANHGFYVAVADVLAALVTVERTEWNLPAPCVPLQMAQTEPAPDAVECNGCAG